MPENYKHKIPSGGSRGSSTNESMADRRARLRGEQDSERNKIPSGGELKGFMKSCGLEAWHSHIVKHTTLRTPQQLRMITAFDLKKMATAANFRLDQKTIDQVRQPSTAAATALARCFLAS